jgi:exopolysaccharide biosynthesis WecB/TagA/CpsF family protein
MINNRYLRSGRAAFGQFRGESTRPAAFGTAGSRRRVGWRSAEKEVALSADVLGESAGDGARRLLGWEVRRLLGVDVTVATLDQAIGQLATSVMSGRLGIWGFCNAHTANIARSNAEFAAALQQMTIFNDGVGVDLASRSLYGTAFPDNLNGTDLTPRLLDGLPTGTPVYLLGSPPGVAEQAAAALEGSHGISVVGTHHGFFAADEEEEIVAAIRDSGARLVLVGMGNPRQEMWAARHSRAIKVPLLCVGAFLDFSAGRISRAPALMRAMRVEWIYRLILEPRRMAKRYVTGNLSFLFAVLCQRLAQGSHD